MRLRPSAFIHFFVPLRALRGSNLPQMKTLAIAALIAFSAVPRLTAEEVVKIEITCNDQMTYNTKAFEVTAGDKVALTLKNVGKIPLKTMGHNLVIVKPGTNVAAFAGKASADKTNLLPLDDESKAMIFKNTKRLGGGESDTIYFIAPEPGVYPYLCTTLGHFSEMQGVMTVKAK